MLSRHGRFIATVPGAFLSSIGTWIQSSALLWYVRHYTASNDTLVAVVNMAVWVPVLFLGFFGGAISDRFDRQKVIITSQLVMAGSALLVAIGLTFDYTPFGLLVAVLTVGGIGYAFFAVAWVAIQPCLVSAEALHDAVAINNFQFNMARFIGPFLGGIILSWWLPAAAYINVLTFMVFIFLILFVKADVHQPPPFRHRIFKGVASGFRYIRETKWMLQMLLGLVGMAFFGFSFIVLLPAACRQMLNAGDVQYGLLFGMTGLGAVIGMPTVTFLHGVMREENIVRVGAATATGLLVAFAFSRTYWLSCLIAFGLGAAFLVLFASANSTLIRRSRQDMQGRVSSMWVVSWLGVYPVGGLLLGAVTDYWSAQTALLVGAIGCALVTLAFILMPMGRKLHASAETGPPDS